MKGYKGFNEDLTCLDRQYKLDETAEEEEALLCKKGLHFCTYPFDIFPYYHPNRSRYCEVEADDVATAQVTNDSKQVAKKLFIKKELSLLELVMAEIKCVVNDPECDKLASFIKGNFFGLPLYDPGFAGLVIGNHSCISVSGVQNGASAKGYYSCSIAKGHHSQATSIGFHSSASTMGRYSHSSVTGNESGAIALGTCSNASVVGSQSVAATKGTASMATVVGDDTKATSDGSASAAVTVGDDTSTQANGSYSGAFSIGTYSKAKTKKYHSSASVVGQATEASADGEFSIASAVGCYAHAIASTGSIAVAIGAGSRVKGSIGAFLILAECKELREDDLSGKTVIEDVKVVKVDGEIIKEDTWYTLRNGEPTEWISSLDKK